MECLFTRPINLDPVRNVLNKWIDHPRYNVLANNACTKIESLLSARLSPFDMFPAPSNTTDYSSVMRAAQLDDKWITDSRLAETEKFNRQVEKTGSPCLRALRCESSRVMFHG